MKRRTGSRFFDRSALARFRLPRSFPLAKATRSVALQTLRDNGNGSDLAKPLECDASRRFHLFPKAAALSQMMGKDALRRLFDFI
jgi:hypothetical protein